MKVLGYEFARGGSKNDSKTPPPNVSEKAAISANHDLFSRYGMEIKADGELDISDYREMMEDPQVRAAVMFKILARVSSGWDIEPASEDARDVEIAEFVEANLERMRGTMSGFLRRSMLSMAYGTSIHEMVLEVPDSGALAGKVCLKELKWKRPEHFRCVTDEYGNLTKLQQKLGFEWQDLDPLYFVVWAWDHEGDYKGRSDLVPAYRWFKSKKLIDWVWNIFLEKYATPTPVGKFPPGADATAKKEVLQFLENLPLKRAAVVPQNWAVEMLESARTGGDYEAKLKYCDRMIARALLLPTLVLDEGSSGAYALGQQHADTFTWVLNAMGEELAEEIMQEQIIRPLVDWNFPDVEERPKFVWRPYDTVDLKNLSEALNVLINAKVIRAGETWIREKLDLPPMDAAEIDAAVQEAADAAEAAKAATAAAVAGQKPQDAAQAGADKAADKKAANDTAKKKGAQKGKEAALSARGISRKFDAKVIKARNEDIENQTVKAVAAATAGMRARLRVTLAKKRIVENRDHEAVRSLKLGGAGEIRAALEKAYGDILHHGVQDAIIEVRAGLASTGKTLPPLPKTMKLNLSGLVAPEWEPPAEVALSSAEIIDFWESKVPVQKDLLALYTREAFTMAGVYQDDLLVGAQRIIDKGIRRGASGAQVEAELDAFFRPYLEVEGALDPRVLSAWRLETVIRTNLAEAYNTGRMNLFRDPAVMDYIVAYQYAAVMDNRTTPFCEDWNDVVIMATDPMVDSITPPNHYCCRSVLIPITRGEAFDTPEDLPSSQPAEGFAFRGGCC